MFGLTLPFEEPRSALKENYWVGLVYMRLVYMRFDPHLPKLYPRAHADVGACHERPYAYGCDLVLPRLGQGSFWRLKALKVDASDNAGFSGCIAAIVPARNEAELIGPVVTSLLNQSAAMPVLLRRSSTGTAGMATAKGESRTCKTPTVPKLHSARMRRADAMSRC